VSKKGCGKKKRKSRKTYQTQKEEKRHSHPPFEITPPEWLNLKCCNSGGSQKGGRIHQKTRRRKTLLSTAQISSSNKAQAERKASLEERTKSEDILGSAAKKADAEGVTKRNLRRPVRPEERTSEKTALERGTQER